MSKIISTVMAIFMFVSSLVPFIIGADGRTFGRETLVLEADSFPVGTERVEGIRHNGTFRSVGHGPYYQLEKRDNGVWLRVEPKELILVDAMYPLQPFNSGYVSCDLTNYDPPLEAGRYRVVVGEVYGEFVLE